MAATSTSTTAVMQALEQRFLSIGFDKKRAADTTKNAKLSAALVSMLDACNVAQPDKALGTLIYTIATEFPDNSVHHQMLARLCGCGKIATKQQLTAAFKHLTEKSPKQAIQDTDKAFESACGIGVVVSKEQVVEAVKRAIAACPATASTGDVMKALKGDESLKWADQALMKTVLDELKPAAVAPKKEKKASPAPSTTPAAATAPKEEEKDENEVDLEKLVEKRNWIKELPSKTAGQRVRVAGWVAHSREGRRGLVFAELRDGTGCVQCVISSTPARIDRSGLLLRETSVELVGTLSAIPEGKKPPTREPRTINFELQVEHWCVLGKSSLDLEKIITPESDVPQRLDFRHLALRSPKGMTMLRVRAAMLAGIREYYGEKDFVEVTPPTMVQTSCEGGSDLFEIKYFEEKAWLTQSSQLYLETVLPIVGNTFCILPSFRAERSRTPRHLTEYTHLEAEMPFIKFEDLMCHLEDIVCSVCEKVMAKCGDLVLFHNPNFKVPKKPFKRMSYRDAIKFCQEHDIPNAETGKPFVYGEDITEKPERRMTDMIGEPIFMTRFPAEMKAFYMARCKDDPTETESCDLLMPGVGEIVGGSMRIWDYEELMNAYKRVGIDPKPYYWFTDQRKYGSVPHGGYGIGAERFLMWMLGEDHIRNLCLFPRFVSRCLP